MMKIKHRIILLIALAMAALLLVSLVGIRSASNSVVMLEEQKTVSLPKIHAALYMRAMQTVRQPQL